MRRGKKKQEIKSRNNYFLFFFQYNWMSMKKHLKKNENWLITYLNNIHSNIANIGRFKNISVSIFWRFNCSSNGNPPSRGRQGKLKESYLEFRFKKIREVLKWKIKLKKNIYVRLKHLVIFHVFLFIMCSLIWENPK